MDFVSSSPPKETALRVQNITKRVMLCSFEVPCGHACARARPRRSGTAGANSASAPRLAVLRQCIVGNAGATEGAATR